MQLWECADEAEGATILGEDAAVAVEGELCWEVPRSPVQPLPAVSLPDQSPLGCLMSKKT